jgi:hypothetical protein
LPLFFAMLLDEMDFLKNFKTTDERRGKVTNRIGCDKGSLWRMFFPYSFTVTHCCLLLT